MIIGINPNPAKVKPILKINKIVIKVPANRVISLATIILGITIKTKPPLNAKINPVSIIL